jgi:uncharacterized protein (DUF362 family)
MTVASLEPLVRWYAFSVETPTEELVVVARSESPNYGDLRDPQRAPELPGGVTRNVAQATVRHLFHLWGLDKERFGTAGWNPFCDLVDAGARITLKPNWVLHYNQSGASLDCLITHPSVIEAVAQYAALNRPAMITIGDAPLQGCDFGKLMELCGLDGIARNIEQRFGVPCRIVDFRRTVLAGGTIGGHREEGRRPESNYVLFDLGERSLLEPLAWEPGQFRVTMYNPDYLNRTHTRGRHQYLVAREVIDADLVVNLPKLKTHMKAGITGALKNLVGINGNKEYLPHHRKGGSGDGGDCYEGTSWFKTNAENMYDIANRSDSATVQTVAAQSARVLIKAAAVLGDNTNLEGAWYGNDTVWRMCLDLQRILRYGRRDGSLATEPQRKVVSVTDAIVGGEGEGPLRNTPISSGFLTASLSTAAAEWVHARLMGFDPEKVPLVREAFRITQFPLAAFAPSDIRVRLEDQSISAGDVFPLGQPFDPPRGWRGHCELT